MIEDEEFIEDEILPYLTKEICIMLNENKDELKKIIWNDNESNVDGGFSIVAKKYCEIAFKKLGFPYELAVDTPDI